MARYNYPRRNTGYSSSRSTFKPRSLRRYEDKAKFKLFATIAISGILIVVFLLWGLPTLIGGLSFLNNFKNKPKIASAVEDVAIAPPVLNIPYEATNTATIKINGFATPNSKVEIYFDDDLKTTVSIGSDGTFSTDDLSLALGTNNIYGKTLDDQGKKSLSSKNIRLIFNNQKPKLDISSPNDNQEIKGGDKKIVVAGKTEPVNTITVNDLTVIVNNDGSFSTSININDGDNYIKITATDEFGNSNQIQRKVIYTAS